MLTSNGQNMQGLRIRVPATTANLGAAFDAVGLALRLYLTVEVRRLGAGPSRLEFAGEGEGIVPLDASNLVWRVMEAAAAKFGCRLPEFSLQVRNEIPVTKGLGSSATACVAAAAATDFLCDLRLTAEDMLAIAVAEEGHPDNVAPALYGGLVASICADRILCSRSEFPPEWSVVAVTPDLELETKKARAVLPRQIPFADAVFNVQRASFLMAQIVQGRREGVRQAMIDRLHQPYRSSLIPGLKEILEIDDREGLIGVALSGAGSTVVAFADSEAEEIGADICSIFKRHGLSAQTRNLKADNQGLVIESLLSPPRNQDTKMQ
jgi:homoserine kinase